MKAIRTFAAVALLLAAAAPSRAIVFYCSDFCSCSMSCSFNCYDDNGNRTTCRSYGLCPGTPDCLVATTQTAAPEACEIP